MISKEEALREIAGLKKEVQEWKEHVLGTVVGNKEKRIGELETQFAQLRQGLQATQSDFAAISGENEGLQREIGILRKKLEGYAKLDEAIRTIKFEGGVSEDVVRRIVGEELAKSGAPAAGPSAVVLTEQIPYVDLKVSKPWLPLDESTLEGQITVLALNGNLPEKFVFSDVVKTIEVEYSWSAGGGSQRKRLQVALDALVGKYKVLERRIEGNQQTYRLRDDARPRVKESETREAMEVKQG